MWTDFFTSNLTALLVGSFIFLLFLARKKRGRNVPPGPRGWPIVGNLFLLSGDIIQNLENLRKEYGDVYSLYLGNVFTVFVHGYDGVKEVLVTRGDEFAERPKLVSMEEILQSKGVVSSSGETWKELRRFTLHSLRDFGFGKSSLEGKIMEEVGVVLQTLESKQGKSFSQDKLIQYSVSNVICSITFGYRFDHSNKEFQTLFKALDENFAAGGAGALNFLPWLKYLPGDLFYLKRSVKNKDLVEEFFVKHIEQHKTDFDAESPRDFVDCFLVEMERQPESKIFKEDQLIKVVLDLFAAGTETSSTTIEWALIYLINNQTIQEKVRAEIHEVIGKSRLPSIADRKLMPYMEATIMETQRCADMVYLNLPHGPAVDTTLRGYEIPKETVIFTSLTSVLKDPTYWKDPETFDPSRFLDAQGHVVKSELFIPFAAGKRVCIGESLAKMELFLFLTSMLQRFVFKPPEGITSLPTDGNLGVTRAPNAFQMRAILDL